MNDGADDMSTEEQSGDAEAVAPGGNSGTDDTAPNPGTTSSKKEKKGRKAKERLKADLAAAENAHRRLKRALFGVGAVAVLCAGGTVGFAIAHHSASTELTDYREQADSRKSALEGARKAAEEYTTRALTIDYQKSSDYVKGLARGTTEAFGKTFSLQPNGAGALTKELLDQLRMVSEGEVVYAFLDGDPTADHEPGQPWNFVVAARQTSTTTQQPERTTTAVILRVAVVDVNGEWKIANFAPDPKIQGGESGLIPGAK